MNGLSAAEAVALVEQVFRANDVVLQSTEVHEYPEETIVVTRVLTEDFDRAVALASSTDGILSNKGFRGFVVVRKAAAPSKELSFATGTLDLGDPQATELANLLAARSRTSEVQPSLSYIPDATHNISAIQESRNHLVFGRRGAGKTALMVEAKRLLEQQGHVTVWVNIQTHRHEGPARTYAHIARAILDCLTIQLQGRDTRILVDVSRLSDRLDSVLQADIASRDQVLRYIPDLQRVIRRFTEAFGVRLYVFLDDIHYLRSGDQPLLLDMVHGSTREADAWLKIAGIKHLSRWYQPSPPMGLQSGHDAAHIDLDLTLESPTEAKRFLDQMLDSYARHVGFASAKAVFSEDSLNRLVLAAGAVPRDYLVLASSALRQARKRPKARRTGVQDVNRAAGDQSKLKLAELEDDAAAAPEGGASRIISALNRVRAFCLDEKKYTYFRVDFRDKEKRPKEYALVQALLDVRILHLVAPSLSDKHQAGTRAEVFMLDLSQFTGQRLKKYLYVLDFANGHIVLKKTSTTDPVREGDSPRRLQDVLRRGPLMELGVLAVSSQLELAGNADGVDAGLLK
jgi:hypothetical protein